MEPDTVRPLMISLYTVRSAIMDKLRDQGDRETRAALFEAQHSVGFALLHLERVEFVLNSPLIDGEVVVEHKGFKLNG